MRALKTIYIIALFFLLLGIVDKLTNPSIRKSLQELSQQPTFPNVIVTWTLIGFIVIIIYYYLIITYQYHKYTIKTHQKNKTDATLIELVIKLLAILFRKTFKKRFFQSIDQKLQIKDVQISQLLASNGIDPSKVKEFAKAALDELAKFYSGKENRLKEITLKPAFTKLSENYQPLTQLFTLQPTSPYLVNFRYSAYEKAFSVYSKFIFNKANGNVYEKGYFITFVDNGGFKIAAVESEDQSYVMKFENFLSAKPKFIFFDYEKIKSLNLELKFAEIFYEIYSWWKGERDSISKNLFFNEDTYSKLIEAKQKIKKNNTEFHISDIKVSNIEILNIREEFLDLSLMVIARIVFYIKGKFAKDSIVIMDEEKISDEMWEFKIIEGKILLFEILKKEGRIKQNPLQIEWHL